MISVDKNTCIGCGACASLCPASFAMDDDGKAKAINGEGAECAPQAAESCPVQAISLA